MILISKLQLRSLIAGRALTITAAARKRNYQKQHTYAAGLTHRKTSCHVQVLEITEVDEKTVRLKVQYAPAGADKDRWLNRGLGYTNNAQAALLREDAPAVDHETQEQITRQGTLRWRQEHQDREIDTLARTLGLRLKDAKRRRDAGEVARIRVELERLEQLLRDAA